MNAAARLLNKGMLSRRWVLSIIVNQIQLSLFISLFMVIFTAFGMIYVTNHTRSVNASLQQAMNERDRLHVQWGQLLLEKSMLLTQARVQTIAEERLGMIYPEGKSIKVITKD